MATATTRSLLRHFGRCHLLQAAGYIGKTLEESKPLHEVVVAAVQAANQSLVGPRRLWVMGGAGASALGLSFRWMPAASVGNLLCSGRFAAAVAPWLPGRWMEGTSARA